MDREQAVRFLSALKSLSPGLDEATAITFEITDAEEGEILRRELGGIMVEPLFNLVMHVIQQYPDLDPDKAH